MVDLSEALAVGRTPVHSGTAMDVIERVGAAAETLAAEVTRLTEENAALLKIVNAFDAFSGEETFGG